MIESNNINRYSYHENTQAADIGNYASWALPWLPPPPGSRLRLQRAPLPISLKIRDQRRICRDSNFEIQLALNDFYDIRFKSDGFKEQGFGD